MFLLFRLCCRHLNYISKIDKKQNSFCSLRQRNRHTSPDPLKQGNHPSPGPLRKGKDHDSPDRLRKEHRHSPDPLRQGKPHSPALLRHGNRHTSPDQLRKGNRHTSPDIPRQGSRDTSPDHRGGNFGDGNGSHSKALIKPKSSKKRDKLKGKPPLPTSPEQRQNEYDWHSCQFTFKVGKVRVWFVNFLKFIQNNKLSFNQLYFSFFLVLQHM